MTKDGIYQGAYVGIELLGHNVKKELGDCYGFSADPADLYLWSLSTYF